VLQIVAKIKPVCPLITITLHSSKNKSPKYSVSDPANKKKKKTNKITYFFRKDMISMIFMVQ